MDERPKHPSPPLPALAFAWLALCALTLASLGLGHWFHGAAALPFVVAVIVWVKGVLVARRFIESHQAHPYIAWILRIFIAFAPIMLVVTGFFSREFARWASL